MVLVAFLWFLSKDARADPSTSQIIAKLNAERIANGIPAGITENTVWTQDCRAHIGYMLENHYFGHAEQPGRPGYTAAGAWAGRSSVLSFGSSWAAGDPFDNSPFHLSQLMNPSLRSVGAAEHDGYSCVTTVPGYSPVFAVTSETLWSWPGNGTVGFHWAWTFDERPHSPGDDVGVSERAVTGPEIILYDAGPVGFGAAGLLQSATLTGPSGPVAARIVNSQLDPLAAQGTGFVIAVHPLQPNSAYTVSATFGAPPRGSVLPSSADSFTFTTSPKPPTRSLLSFGKLGRRGRFLVLQLRVTGWPLTVAHRTGFLIASIGHRRGTRFRIRINSGPIRLPLVLRRQHDTIRVVVPSFTYGGVRFSSAVIAKRL